MVRYLGKPYHNIFSLPITALAFDQLMAKGRANLCPRTAGPLVGKRKIKNKDIKLIIKIIILIT